MSYLVFWKFYCLCCVKIYHPNYKKNKTIKNTLIKYHILITTNTGKERINNLSTS